MTCWFGTGAVAFPSGVGWPCAPGKGLPKFLSSSVARPPGCGEARPDGEGPGEPAADPAAAPGACCGCVSVAFLATEGGSDGATVAAADTDGDDCGDAIWPGELRWPVWPGETACPGGEMVWVCPLRLVTVIVLVVLLTTTVLWMLLKNTVLGGGAT